MDQALPIEQIAYAGLAEMEAASGDTGKAAIFARIVLEMFNAYYTRSRRIPSLAKAAFETRDWPGALALSQERIAIFGTSIGQAVPPLKLVVQEQDRAGGFWSAVERNYRALVLDRYEAELALAYLNSVRRHVFVDSWMPVSYVRDRTDASREAPSFLHCLEAASEITPETVKRVLAVPGIKAQWRDIDDDTALVADRIEREIDPSETVVRIDVVKSGFYRNRGAYIVGGIGLANRTVPLMLALLHAADGVYVDAVILREKTLRHVFSSTLANFHVDIPEYHALVDYLFSLMPARPRGMHYSTVGYNHVGKLAVMEQITNGLVSAPANGQTSAQALDHAPGPPGSVAIGFTAPAIDYVLKVIRNKPTASYKWDRFDGIAAVLNKYRRVHGINRSGSMLDNINYTNLTLPREVFGEALLEDLLDQASDTVSLYRNEVFLRHLIVQRKLIPVPLYLAECTAKAAEMAVIRLGQCIRNNAASNVFNKDLDGRNYGVSTLGFVYLFDYDAVETLTEIKVRTNRDREDGEEDIPDWFFEDGPVFLPEELEAHLRLPDRNLRRLFREAHGELLKVEYWTRMQGLLAEGKVPRIRTYPRSAQVRLPEAGA